MMNINLMPLLEAIIVLLGTIITSVLVPWIKARTTEVQQAHIQAWVSTAVYAAEKLFGAGHGAEKLQYAEGVLAEHGIDIDAKTLMALVNAEIKRMEQMELPEGIIETEVE